VLEAHSELNADFVGPPALPRPNSRPTLARAIDVYRVRVSILKKGFAQEAFRLQQLQRSDLGALVMDEVTSVDIASYRDARLAQLNPKTLTPISPATVRLELSLLSNIFEVARIEWGFCSGTNPCRDVRKPKVPPGRARRLTPREDRQIQRYAYSSANAELFSIVVLALETCMRQGEILNLEWQHVNLRSRIVHLPETKNGSPRDVPLTTDAVEAFTRLGVKQSGRVFHYTPAGIKSTWRYMLSRLGIEDLHFHDLRHEAISRLFERGTLDMLEIAAISGHKSLSMLKRYTHLRATRLVRKLDGQRSRSKQAVLNLLLPYPAVVDCRAGSGVSVSFPDFSPPLSVSGQTRVHALQLAQSALLRLLCTLMRDGARVPEPDQYLQPVDRHSLVMVDPLAPQTEQTALATESH
jgi:integrase